jgi:hypothetical protein
VARDYGNKTENQEAENATEWRSLRKKPFYMRLPRREGVSFIVKPTPV